MAMDSGGLFAFRGTPAPIRRASSPLDERIRLWLIYSLPQIFLNRPGASAA
jgi:hypothetical protein